MSSLRQRHNSLKPVNRLIVPPFLASKIADVARSVCRDQRRRAAGQFRRFSKILSGHGMRSESTISTGKRQFGLQRRRRGRGQAFCLAQLSLTISLLVHPAKRLSFDDPLSCRYFYGKGWRRGLAEQISRLFRLMVSQQRFRLKDAKSPTPKRIFVPGLTITHICFLNRSVIVALLEFQVGVIVEGLPVWLAANETHNAQTKGSPIYGNGRPPLEVVPPPSVVPVLPEHICT